MEEVPSPKDQRKEGPPEQLEAAAEAEKATVRGITPVEGEAVAVHVMEQGAVTVTVPLLEHVRPLEDAVIVHVYVPEEVYSCTEFFWCELAPSPKVHSKATLVEVHPVAVAEPAKFTVRGAVPEEGLAEAPQVRAQLESTAMVPPCVQLCPATVTVSPQVKFPGAPYVWVGFCCVEVTPSPKVQA